MTTMALYTSGDMARILGAKVQTVRHILHTRTFIQPQQRAGIVNLYDGDALEAVRAELAQIEAKRDRRESAGA